MKLAIFGSNGMIGSRILAEVLSRGHILTAIVRDPSRFSLVHNNLTVVASDVLDPKSVAAVVANHDAVLSAVGPGSGSPEIIVDAARSLIDGLSHTELRRLVVVGGAGVLDVAPGVKLMESPNFTEAYRPLAVAHLKAYELYQASDLNWTFVCPAGEIAPGERTGKFQVGMDYFLVNKQGESRISAEDYAIGFVDEVEQHQYVHHRMTLAY